MATITALNVRLGMDASNFSAGADLARSEVNRVAATMRQSVPPAEKYKREIDLLNRAFSDSGRQTKEYANAVEFLRKKHGQSLPAAASAKGSIDAIKQSMMNAVPGGSMLAGALAGPLGAALALAAGLALVSRALSQAATRIDETAKAAKTAGLAFGELVAIQMLAGETVGVGSEGVNKAVRELSKRLAEARVKGGDLDDVLKAAGLSAEELAKGDPAEAFRKVSDVIAGIPNRAEQIRVAVLAVGKEGAKMVEMFALGSGAIDDMKAEAQRLGAILSDDSVAAIETMNDRFDRSKMAIDGIWNSLLSQVAPALTHVAKLMEDFFVFIRISAEETEKMVPIFSTIGFIVGKMVDGFRFIIGLASDIMSMLGSLPGMLTGGELNVEFAESNRLLDELEARSNGTAAQIAAATAETEMLAMEAEKAAEAASKVEESYANRVRDLTIESVALAGNAELAEQMKMQAEGYSKTQIESLQTLEKQNETIRERIKAEEELAKAEAKRVEDAAKQDAKRAEEIKKMAQAVDDAFSSEVSATIDAVNAYFEEQKSRDDQRRKDVSAGPGAGMEAGSAEAIKFMADQVNASIGAAAVPELPTPGEKEIADKARELLIAQRESNAKQAEQLETTKQLLDAFKENKFTRIR